MGQAISVVDAFTDAAFRGNPAAVCLLSGPTTEAWMQSVAAEMNLSETAFAVPRPDGSHDLRWFTPTTEVDLCGHATLATTHVLGGEARFHTRSGPLTCRRAKDGTVEMDFPAAPVEPVTDPPDWSAPLGVGAERVAGVWAGSGWLMVELAAAADVREVRPDLAAIVALCDVVVVVAPGDRPGIDSACRVFGPGVGVDEDPVTGSAHCMIAPWLAARTGGTRFTGEQVSVRGGTVGMRLAGDRVVLAGSAVTVLEGTLQSDPPPA